MMSHVAEGRGVGAGTVGTGVSVGAAVA